MVDLRGDEMNRATVDARAVVERTLVRIEPGVGGEQRRMDVEHPTFIAAHKGRTENAHESRQHDEVGRARIDRCCEGPIERISAVEGPLVDDLCRDAMALRDGEARRIGAIADHGRHGATEYAAAFRVDERTEIRAATGNENGDADAGAGSCLSSQPFFPLSKPLSQSLSKPCRFRWRVRQRIRRRLRQR